MRLPLLLLLLGPPGTAAAQGSLRVEVILNKPGAGGVLHVALYPSAKAYKHDRPCATERVEVAGRTAACILGGIAPRTYAVRVFHDLNGNGKLDTSRIGWPQEPYGFSNDAPVNAGPPPFKLAAIEVKEGAQAARVLLR